MKRNTEARKASLQRLMKMGESPVIPICPVKTPEANPEELETIVAQGYFEATIGKLLERARRERGVGKRELARTLGTSHGRIGTLENAKNLELKSLLEFASALDYDLELSLIPRSGGHTLGTVMRLET